MTSFFQNLAWAVFGACVVLVIIKLAKRNPSKQPTERKDNQPTEPQQPIPIDPHTPPEPQKWVPAEIAVKENLNKITPLLRGVSKDGIENRQKWTEVIVSIKNEDLTDMWMSATTKPSLWSTYLQTFGLQCDLVSEFICLSEYHEMYETKDGSTLVNGKNYIVEAPCWIFTDSENSKRVVLKGIVSEK